MLLSNARQNTERTTALYEEMAERVQDPDVKEGLESRVFVSEKILSQIDQCFKLLGEAPVKPNDRLQTVFAEDFRKELAEIENQTARRLFILAKASQLAYLRIAELAVLTAAADLSGHYGVGVLLESCLADKIAFVERTRRFIRKAVESKVAGKLAA